MHSAEVVGGHRESCSTNSCLLRCLEWDTRDERQLCQHIAPAGRRVGGSDPQHGRNIKDSEAHREIYSAQGFDCIRDRCGSAASQLTYETMCLLLRPLQAAYAAVVVNGRAGPRATRRPALHAVQPQQSHAPRMQGPILHFRAPVETRIFPM